MARIDWAVVCDHAYLDREERLCIVGVARRFPVPTIPASIGQLMLIARLAELQPVEEVDVSVAVVTPSGALAAPADGRSIAIEMAREYVFATLRDIPLSSEGVYRFQISLEGQRPVVIDLPVLSLNRTESVRIH